MNRKIGKHLVAAALVIVAIVATGQSAHAAATISTRTDRASYVPSDGGTLIVTIVNTSGGSTLELRNLTIYFPWAQLVDGKWPSSGANVTVNLSPFVQVGSANSGNNVYTYSTPFTIPGWYGGSIFGISNPMCPDPAGPRYSTSYNSCVFVGVTGNPPMYVTHEFGIVMALATYTPSSIVSLWLPITTLAVLVIATVFLALAWTSLRRMSKKQ